MLHYVKEIQEQKEVQVNKAYIEELDNYIGAKVVVPGKYYISVLARGKLRKRCVLSNLIVEEQNHLLDGGCLSC